MGTRLELQNKLEELLGSRNVYYQAPPSTGMNYPAILYSKEGLKTEYANGVKYSTKTKYQAIVIDKRPDNPVINKILELPYSSYDRSYNSDNLYHDTLTLFY